MATGSRSSLRRLALDAYRSLGDGDALPLVELLDREVEWAERTGPGRVRTVSGAAAVGALLTERIGAGRTVELRSVAVERDALVLSFSRPWWDNRPRSVRSFLVKGLGGRFVQTVTLGRLIERIESAATLAASPDPVDEYDFATLGMLLHR